MYFHRGLTKSLSSKTKALIVVHLYGRSCDLNYFQSFCTSNSIHLIEDCAQAHLARCGSSPVGSFGSFAAWSFYPTKNLGAIGDAGAITSNNLALLDSARQFRNYGQKDRYHHELPGMNSRLDEIQAALLSKRLLYLQRWTEQRRNIALRYFSEISNPYITLLAYPDDLLHHVHHLFVVTSPFRSQLQQHLLEQGIQALIHYPVPCHLQKALGQHRITPSGLPISERHAAQCLSLPIHPYLEKIEVDHVISSCNSFHV